MANSDERLYRVSFLNQGQLYEIYARHVSQGGFFGFIEVEELLFGERSRLVVDPSEERLRTEFEGVRRMFIPMHSVVRVDEVEKVGAARIAAAERGSGSVTPFPLPLPGAGSDPTKR
ncbi:MAG: DUF1820 family protein [Acidobacteriota bacterium]